MSLIGYFYVANFLATYKKATVEINDKSFKVDVAETMGARAKGLSGREKLDDDEGMFFIFGAAGNYGFWMKNMKFPIDILWIKDNRIAGITSDVQPQAGVSDFSLKIYYPPESVKHVLEVNAGVAEKLGFKIGDLVRF